MLNNIENHKKVYEVMCNETDTEYSLIIIADKEKETYRIINLTEGYIYPQNFSTYDEAEDSIYEKQSEGKYEILGMHSIII